jgi:hypothetical protein
MTVWRSWPLEAQHSIAVCLATHCKRIPLRQATQSATSQKCQVMDLACLLQDSVIEEESTKEFVVFHQVVFRDKFVLLFFQYAECFVKVVDVDSN